MMQPLFHENSNKRSRQADEQTGEPEPVHPDVRGSGDKCDGRIEGGRGDGVDWGTVGDSTLNEDRFIE